MRLRRNFFSSFFLLPCVLSLRTSPECELNGLFDSRRGVCDCGPGWTGTTCGELELLEAPLFGVWPTQAVQLEKPRPRSKSWGFSMVKGDDGMFHGYVDTGCFDCDNVDATGNNQIVHVCSESPTGPFRFEDVALPINAFNPHIIKLNSGKYALLFRRNEQSHEWEPCFGDEGAPAHPVPTTNSTELAKEKGMNLALSRSPQGPWEIHPLEIHGMEGVHVSNPSMIQLKNGTFLMAFRYNTNMEHVGIAGAEKVQGPFRFLTTLDVPGEDPFLWQDISTEYFHIIFHVENARAYSEWPSLHAFSIDGLDWHTSKSRFGPYSTTVRWADGTKSTFSRRERPGIIFDESGNMEFLLTAVLVKHAKESSYCRNEFTFSVIQPILSHVFTHHESNRSKNHQHHSPGFDKTVALRGHVVAE